MKKYLFLMAAGVLLLSLTVVIIPRNAQADNDYPIILVHPWAFKGPILNGIQDLLTGQGYDTFTPAMGPYSSTWDRACELYAQIKGGTVDYGLAHSNKYKHARYGRTYPGFYPEWGQVDPAARAINKVHLIGYCYGGLTSRMMIQLLAKGSTEEIAATPASGLSGLFSGGNSWVLSLTSVVTPHNGTSLLDEAFLGTLAYTDVLRYLLMMMAPGLSEGAIYDLQMDQWGFYAKTGESVSSMLLRLASASFWINNKDFSNYDMLPNGIYAMNSWVKAQPDVYYFSLAADGTYKDLLGFNHPVATMQPLFWGFANYMGSHIRFTYPFSVTSKWWPNDGTVNTVSMSGPTVGTGTKDAIVNYNGVPQIGKWNFMGIIKGVDHFQILEITNKFDGMAWFSNHAELLSSL